MAIELSLADLIRITGAAKNCVSKLTVIGRYIHHKEFRDTEDGDEILKMAYSKLIRDVQAGYPDLDLEQHKNRFNRLSSDPADSVLAGGKSFGNAHSAAIGVARSVLERTWYIVAPDDCKAMVLEAADRGRLVTPDFDVELVPDKFEQVREEAAIYFTGEIASLGGRIDREHALLRKEIEGDEKGAGKWFYTSEADIPEKFRGTTSDGKPLTHEGILQELARWLGSASKREQGSYQYVKRAVGRGETAVLRLGQGSYRIYHADHDKYAQANKRYLTEKQAKSQERFGSKR